MRLHKFAFASKPVPGTRGQAIVTAVDALADQRTQFDRNWTFELDRQIRDTPAGIELEWACDRSRGTQLDAPRTRAATIDLGSVRLQLQRGENLGEEYPVPELATDEVRMLANKTESGALCEIAFKDRTGIDIP